MGKVDKRYYADVGFVKHGHACFEDMWEEFAAQQFQANRSSILYQAFEYLYKSTCFGGSHTQAKMQEFIDRSLDIPPELKTPLQGVVTVFYITVYSSAWRCRFLEAIDKAGIELALYGNDWEKHKRLGHLARGPVDRTTELNYVYNYNKINLSINNAASMHQRLSECGLAGGFMMVADPGEGDWGNARDYFAEDELVMFKTPEELVEKCHYHLGHHPDMKKGENAIDIKGIRWKVA